MKSRKGRGRKYTKEVLEESRRGRHESEARRDERLSIRDEEGVDALRRMRTRREEEEVSKRKERGKRRLRDEAEGM